MDEIITALSQFCSLFVIARQSGFTMSIGQLGRLDSIAAIAKVAAASLDDVATQAAKAGAKAVAVVIDDTAVTPRYVLIGNCQS